MKYSDMSKDQLLELVMPQRRPAVERLLALMLDKPEAALRADQAAQRDIDEWLDMTGHALRKGLLSQEALYLSWHLVRSVTNDGPPFFSPHYSYPLAYEVFTTALFTLIVGEEELEGKLWKKSIEAVVSAWGDPR